MDYLQTLDEIISFCFFFSKEDVILLWNYDPRTTDIFQKLIGK